MGFQSSHQALCSRFWRLGEEWLRTGEGVLGCAWEHQRHQRNRDTNLYLGGEKDESKKEAAEEAPKAVDPAKKKKAVIKEGGKRGSGNIGKMVFSAGNEQLAVLAYVPEAKQGELVCKEWIEHVLKMFPGGKVLSESAGECTGIVPTDSDNNIFPLKIREGMILEANNFLRKKGLFPEDDDDDDEMVFGDDDFPSVENQPAEEAEASEPEVPKKEPKKVPEFDKDKLKKVVKEGGKRGVEIEGAADM